MGNLSGQQPAQLVVYNELDIRFKELTANESSSRTSMTTAQRTSGLITILANFFQVDEERDRVVGMDFCPKFGCMSGIDQNEPLDLTLPQLTVWASLADFGKFMQDTHRQLAKDLTDYSREAQLDYSSRHVSFALPKEFQGVFPDPRLDLHDKPVERLMELAKVEMAKSETQKA